jgi:hypothetical protein
VLTHHQPKPGADAAAFLAAHNLDPGTVLLNKWKGSLPVQFKFHFALNRSCPPDFANLSTYLLYLNCLSPRSRVWVNILSQHLVEKQAVLLLSHIGFAVIYLVLYPEFASAVTSTS